MYNFIKTIKTKCANLFALMVVISFITSSCSFGGEHDSVNSRQESEKQPEGDGSNEPAKPAKREETAETTKTTKTGEGNETTESTDNEDKLGFWKKRPVAEATLKTTVSHIAGFSAIGGIVSGICAATLSGGLSQVANVMHIGGSHPALFAGLAITAMGAGLGSVTGLIHSYINNKSKKETQVEGEGEDDMSDLG